MRKHSLLGVLALAMLLAVAGLNTASAGEKQTYLTSDGESCVLEDGKCVPCPDAACSNTSAKPANAVSISSAAPQLASACGSGPCVPCTPGQCPAGACVPCPEGQQCQASTDCAPGSCGEAGYTMIGVRDANAGQLVVYRVPASTARILMAVSPQQSVGSTI